MASLDGTADCVYRQWFLEVLLGPFTNVNDRIMPMSDAVSPEGPKTTGIQQRSWALSRTEIYQFSLNILMMLCTVDDEICKAFANWMLRNVVFKVLHNLFTHTLTDWRASAHLYF